MILRSDLLCLSCCRRAGDMSVPYPTVMSNTAISSRLNIVANVALITASMTVTAVTVARFLDVGRNAGPVRGYLAGETIELSGVDFSRSDRTLLVVVRSTCHFCTDSMPFYRRIVDERNSGQANVRIIAVSTEMPDVTRAYVRQYDFAPDDVIRMGPGALRVSGTPTLILANQRGQVVTERRGMLPPHEQSAVLEIAFGRRPSSSSSN